MEFNSYFYVVDNGNKKPIAKFHGLGKVYSAIWDFFQKDLHAQMRDLAPSPKGVSDYVIIEKYRATDIVAYLMSKGISDVAKLISHRSGHSTKELETALYFALFTLEGIQGNVAMFYEMREE